MMKMSRSVIVGVFTAVNGPQRCFALEIVKFFLYRSKVGVDLSYIMINCFVRLEQVCGLWPIIELKEYSKWNFCHLSENPNQAHRRLSYIAGDTKCLT